MTNMRRLSHFGETLGQLDIWSVLLIIIFTMGLVFTVYLFWWHSRAFASIPNSEVYEPEEKKEDL